LFNLDAISFADLTSLEPLLMGIMKETCVGVNELTAILKERKLQKPESAFSFLKDN
jgi:hypothetical protein